MKTNRTITRGAVDRTGNGFCGPLVLAALLGCTTAEAAERVRRAIGSNRTVKGMHNRELLATLAAGGLKAVQMDVPVRYVVRRGIGETIADAVSYASKAWCHEYPGGLRLREYGDGPGSPFTPLKKIGVTLAAWLRQRPNKAATYVVNVTGHYVLICGRKFVDTHTRGQWVSLSDAPHRRARVEKVWQIL